MAEEKKKINEQEMEALCKDLWPHITGIRELLVKHGVEKTISLSGSRAIVTGNWFRFRRKMALIFAAR